MNKKTIITALLFIATVTANAQFIFRISGNGLAKPSYILGSLHVLSGELLDSIPAFLEAENQCQQLFVEVDVTRPQYKESSQATGQQLVTLPDGMTISNVMGEDRMKILQERMKETCHIDLADSTRKQFLNYQPYFFTFTLNLMVQFEAMKNYPGLRSGNLLDGACIARAKARGWKVGELDQQEKPEELDKAKETLAQSINEQADTLMALLNNFDERKQKLLKEFEGLQTMCDYWTAGDYAGFERFLQPETEAHPAIYGKRNMKWLPTITAAMKEMPTLFVFGAGHLTGPQGVVQQLREAGFAVEPVK